MTYQEIKDESIVLTGKATRVENGTKVTASRLLRVIDEDEVKIVSETISNLKGDELITELEFLLDNINISDSHISIKTFLKNYKTELCEIWEKTTSK
jgi:hypothetical protein